ncbi:hypothetical protein Droror1_Dr00026910 [Drosera rotundifolia]
MIFFPFSSCFNLKKSPKSPFEWIVIFGIVSRVSRSSTLIILGMRSGVCGGDCLIFEGFVDELGIPVEFVGVGEGVDDLQPFETEAYSYAFAEFIPEFNLIERRGKARGS